MKKAEWIKKEYLKLAEVVNAYKSEQVQMAIVNRLVPLIEKDFIDFNNGIVNLEITTPAGPVAEQPELKPQRIGVTQAILQIIDSDYFIRPRSIGAIVDHCRDLFKESYQTNQFSGILSKLVTDNKLYRKQDDVSNRYVYVKEY